MIALRDPWRRSIVLAVALIVGGFVAILITWVGVAATRVIPTQVAFAVSGGIGGVALLGTGIALLEIQRRRHATAVARRDFATFAAELRDLAELIAERQRRDRRRSNA